MKLKPCPFCGIVPKGAYRYGTSNYSRDGKVSDKVNIPCFAVDHNCAPGHGNSEKEAIENWNKRQV